MRARSRWVPETWTRGGVRGSRRRPVPADCPAASASMLWNRLRAWRRIVNHADLLAKVKHAREGAPTGDLAKAVKLFPFSRRERPLKCCARTTIKDPAEADAGGDQT